jgi:hypothetical protein
MLRSVGSPFAISSYPRTKSYDPNGRYETESEALIVDQKLKQYLDIRVAYDIISYDDFDGIISLVKEKHEDSN